MFLVFGLIIGFVSKLFYLVLLLFPRKLVISCYNFQERIHFHNKTLITFFRLVNPIFDIMDITALLNISGILTVKKSHVFRFGICTFLKHCRGVYFSDLPFKMIFEEWGGGWKMWHLIKFLHTWYFLPVLRIHLILIPGSWIRTG